MASVFAPTAILLAFCAAYLLLGLAVLDPRGVWATPQRAAAEIAFAEGWLAFQSGDDATAAERFKAAAELNPADRAPTPPIRASHRACREV